MEDQFCTNSKKLIASQWYIRAMYRNSYFQLKYRIVLTLWRLYEGILLSYVSLVTKYFMVEVWTKKDYNVIYTYIFLKYCTENPPFSNS
jgi:hypothetical protein